MKVDPMIPLKQYFNRYMLNGMVSRIPAHGWSPPQRG